MKKKTGDSEMKHLYQKPILNKWIQLSRCALLHISNKCSSNSSWEINDWQFHIQNSHLFDLQRCISCEYRLKILERMFLLLFWWLVYIQIYSIFVGRVVLLLMWKCAYRCMCMSVVVLNARCESDHKTCKWNDNVRTNTTEIIVYKPSIRSFKLLSLSLFH